MQQDNKDLKTNYEKSILELKHQIDEQSKRPSVGECLKCP